MTNVKIFVFTTMLVFGCSGKKTVKREIALYPSGSLRFEVKLIDDKREGLGIDYFEDGKIKMKSFWKNGKVDGESTGFYENGNKRQVSFYKDGLCQISMDYSIDGYLEKTREYDSLGRILDFYKYSKDGTRDFSPGTKYPVFITQKDTVRVGENYIATIRLGNRQYSHVDVIIGDVSDRDIIKKNRPLPKKDSLTSILNIKADLPGRHAVSGVIFERNANWDSLAVTAFTHHFYVKK